MSRVLVLGATGRLGAMLQRHWSQGQLQPIWHGRNLQGTNCTFDLLDQHSWPKVLQADIILCFAGIVPGKGDLNLNVTLGEAAVQLGAKLGARRVFLSSSAAIYGGGSGALHEADPLAPALPYGQTKLQMERAAAALGAGLGVAVTSLRIGNVAGADALLAQPGRQRRLDQFSDGQGPRRSYIGPGALAGMLGSLCVAEADSAALPDCLNIALDGAVAMADLCHAAGLEVIWRPAPPEALPEVTLDVTRLGAIIPVPKACPAQIIADWRADASNKEGA